MLPSSHIADVEKSMRYADESDQRVAFHSLSATIDGDHRTHSVAYADGSWTCDCEGFGQNAYCSHTMTLERVLRDMVAMGRVVPAADAEPARRNGSGS